MNEHTPGAPGDGADGQTTATEAEPAAVPPREPGDLERRLDALTRAYADLVNDRESFKRRLERERDRQLEAQKGEIAAALLDSMDELALAVRGAGAEGEGLAAGVRLIAENLGRRAEGLGLARIPAAGHHFDPALHEAIDLVPTPDAEADGRVVEEVRAGWRLGERVIRAARVRVGRYLPPAAPPAGPAPGE